MSKIKIEDEYEIKDELVFCYPNVEVGMIHSLVLDSSIMTMNLYLIYMP